MNKPKISVVMPVYNGEKFLRKALESVLKQDFADFEFIIIDDGSTDTTADIVRGYSDSRIRFIQNGINKGLATTCNVGLDAAIGEYIARMDCDDVCMPARFRKQAGFLDSHPSIGICGTWTKTIGSSKGTIGKFLTDPSELKANLLFFTSLAHPSVMMRRELIVKNAFHYDKAFEPADDYDLWARASEVTVIANVPEVLLWYRTHETNISKTKHAIQRGHSNSIKARLLGKFGMNPTPEELEIHCSLHRSKTKSEALAFVQKAESWLQKMARQNQTTKHYDSGAFTHVLFLQWLSACRANAHRGLIIWKTFHSSPLAKGARKNDFMPVAKLFMRCFLGSFR